ncbi:hypothetical protein KAFR_0K00670 [Kazachstania africana CBS 2517]|uniref:CCR4-Not complex 3'-5'-exoribonuclease subunit Ccr4 n=1 Tax=Kazachstania africana (strain ATCC 22294 / BCRC 22015 / CBS 2517 / CECT 1963 / NBRC 1671 / NRRL Y-8276) TaxID=1071382 RepID=H2B1C2_KAZAF|nr:hypothetical protein KAFR_0K00670 [Kazachstania africana CBS 2517]CCF60422.1 hypothetical protein KAFR_0K00670 [Kazachstania africana CBS 2517]
MNEPSLMGYPNPNIGAVQQSQQNNIHGSGTPIQQLHLNPMMNSQQMPPPGLVTGNDANLVSNSRQLLDQLSGTSNAAAAATNNNNNNNANNANAPLNPNSMTPGGVIMNVNANNPLVHPHLEDPSLVNHPIWKLQLQLASVSARSLGQPNVYARQNAMKKYLANQNQQGPQQMTDASMSLVDRTKQLLVEMAVDTTSEKVAAANNNNGSSTPNFVAQDINNANNSMLSNSTAPTTANLSGISTPSTPQTELHNMREALSGTPAALLQHKKLSQYNIDEDDEVNLNDIKDATKDAQLWHAIDFSNLQVININENLFKYTFLTRLYLNGNGLSHLPADIKKLTNLRVLDLSHNRLTSLPVELGSCYQLKYLYFFDNLIQTLPWELGNLCNLQFLGCEGNPLDKQLLKILMEKSMTGLIFYLRDNRPEVPLPADRKFIEINTDGEPTREFDSLESANTAVEAGLLKKSFTILSYNTLCQHYATPKMYRYTPSWALRWDYRREKLKEQILSYGCDILCLQEVESKTYEDFWAPLLEKNGYTGYFHCKTRAKTMQAKDSKKVDGCCVFYKKSKFKLITKEALDFSGAWQKHKRFQRTEDYLNRAMNKDNVAIYMKLQHVQSGEYLWVVTTHLHWDPKFNDVKTFQVGVLLDHMESIIKEENPKQDVKKFPIIITGDFNSYLTSAVYELFSTGNVKDHPDDEIRDFGFMSQKNFSHHLALGSSYGCIGELPFTNFTPSFTNVIDYIWYSTHVLRVRGLLGPIDEDYVSKFIGFPNDKFPSDHLPLIARIEFTKNNTGSRKV